MKLLSPSLIVEDPPVDPGYRDIGAKAIGDERTQGEPDPALKLGRLRKGPEVYATRELLGG